MAVADAILLLCLHLVRQQAAQNLYNDDVTIKNDTRSNERLWQVQSKAKLFFCHAVPLYLYILMDRI